MKFRYLLILPLIMLFSSWNQSREKKDNILIWNPTYKLKWSDFRGKPDAHSKLNVQTFYGIEVEKNYVVSYDEKIASYIDRNKSWVKDTSAGSLQHEQLHFDIAELYARKMREYAALLQERGLEKREQLISAKLAELSQELHTYQEDYDQETNRGLNAEKQKEWEEKLKAELVKYRFFK